MTPRRLFAITSVIMMCLFAGRIVHGARSVIAERPRARRRAMSSRGRLADAMAAELDEEITAAYGTTDEPERTRP